MMQLIWHEKFLIMTLRVLKPFFSKKGYYINEIEFGGRDGDYITFQKNFIGVRQVRIVYNPSFEIKIGKSVLGMLLFEKK